jgi:ribosomal protein S18 acetylase RimI-like enzyme
MQIADVPLDQRARLETLLEESFEGWYLSHSRKTLQTIETVRSATIGGRLVGLVMLKTFEGAIGYVYYIAVAADQRRKKVGTRLLDHSLGYFEKLGMREAYASIEKDNVESEGLFRSRGFARISYRDVAGKYGHIKALDLYRKMLVVPGETLLCRQLSEMSESAA